MDPVRGDDFLEFGLLLAVTGLFVGVFLLSLTIVLARVSTTAASPPSTIVGVAALACLLAVVLVLLRRVRRLVARI
jgi:nitrate reductase gamma subunit